MATPARSSGLFSGLVLIFAGVLVLLYNYGHLDLGGFVWRWWPLFFILWGVVALYERTAGQRFGGGGGRGGGGSGGGLCLGGGGGRRAGGSDGGLVRAVVGLVAIVALAGRHREWPGTVIDVGDTYSYDIDMAPKKVPANARVMIHNGRGDITVRGSDSGE